MPIFLKISSISQFTLPIIISILNANSSSVQQLYWECNNAFMDQTFLLSISSRFMAASLISNSEEILQHFCSPYTTWRQGTTRRQYERTAFSSSHLFNESIHILLLPLLCTYLPTYPSTRLLTYYYLSHYYHGIVNIFLLSFPFPLMPQRHFSDSFSSIHHSIIKWMVGLTAAACTTFRVPSIRGKTVRWTQT